MSAVAYWNCHEQDYQHLNNIGGGWPENIRYFQKQDQIMMKVKADGVFSNLDLIISRNLWSDRIIFTHILYWQILWG